MAVKIIGAVIVFFSCAAAGMFLACRDRFRADELMEMKRGLLLLKSEIDYSSRPLYEALIDISLKVGGAVSEIFEDCGRLLKSRKASSASEAWETTLKDRKGRTFFHKSDMDALISMGKSLGGGDRRCQLSSIDMAMEYIDLKYEELMKKYSKDGRLFRSGGILCGILIVVALF